jgi:hypothetical protein
MKFLKRLFYWLVFLILCALVLGLFLPTQFNVERSVMVTQPRDTVFNYVKYLKNQEIYGVWWKADPKMKKEYTGTDGQPGFIAAWSSKIEDVGAGQQKIISIQEGKRLDLELQFFEPFESTNKSFIATQQIETNTTRVSWGISGQMPYPSNLMGLFIDMEEMLGQDLEKGLKNLKRVLEK